MPGDLGDIRPRLRLDYGISDRGGVVIVGPQDSPAMTGRAGNRVIVFVRHVFPSGVPGGCPAAALPGRLDAGSGHPESDRYSVLTGHPGRYRIARVLERELAGVPGAFRRT